MCVCVKVCDCVDAIWLEEGAAVGVAYCKEVHNFK